MQRYKPMTFLPTQDKKGRGKKPAFDIHKEREPFFPQSFISGVKDQKRIPAKSVFQRIVDTASNSSGA